jgi:diguanylate cyclase (GGDEF)-like protein
MLCIGLTGPAVAATNSVALGDGLTPVTLQLKWLHQFQFAGYYAAIEQGYYRAAGLMVTLSERNADSSPIDNLMAGEADFAVADVGALMYRSQGTPVVALASVFQHSASILVVREDAQVDTLADLVGKNVRNGQGAANAELIAMLAAGGIAQDDLNIVDGSQSLAFFLSGDTPAINAYSTNEPFILARQGVPFKIFSPSDYGIDFYGDLLLTSERLVADDPALVRKFRAASMAGWDYAVKHPEELISLILQDYNSQQKTRAQLQFEAQETIKLILPQVVPIGYMNERRWQDIVGFFNAQGRIEGKLDLDGFIYQETLHRGDFLHFLAFYYREVLGTLVGLVVLFLGFHVLNLRSQLASNHLELKLAQQASAAEARTDVLTGLSNRRHFLEVLHRDLEHSARHGQNYALIMADVNEFKSINDKYGHAAGDKVLQAIADVLHNEARVSDFYARLGGDEFVIGCRNANAAIALAITERLSHAMGDLRIDIGAGDLHIKLSFGVGCFSGKETPEQLLALADEAMYCTKGQGNVNGMLQALDDIQDEPEDLDMVEQKTPDDSDSNPV